ncbi:MAG: MOSC N-terminal beta barrel domain-containing protein [Actinomycetota bacterium]
MPRPVDGTQVGVVADLWRFPVKSFGGERVRRAFVGPFGLLGDRRYAAVDTDTGEALSARRVSRLLGFSARYGDGDPAGTPLVTTPDGALHSPDDPELAAAVAAATARQVSVLRSPGALHDAAPLHILSLASVAALGAAVASDLDVRRFRPNILVELDDLHPGEDGWPGLRLAIGDRVTVDVVVPTERCAVTTYDPDTLDRDPAVLAALARERDNLFGVYATVTTPGWIAVGDPIRHAAG